MHIGYITVGFLVLAHQQGSKKFGITSFTSNMMFIVLLAFLQFNSAFADCGPSKQNSTKAYQCNGAVVVFKRSDVENGTYKFKPYSKRDDHQFTYREFLDEIM